MDVLYKVIIFAVLIIKKVIEMEDSFSVFFVNCIYFNAICWIIFFVWHLVKKYPLKLEKGEIAMWVVLAICSSVLGPVATFFVGTFVLAYLISKVMEFLDNHDIFDSISCYLNKEVTFKFDPFNGKWAKKLQEYFSKTVIIKK